MLRSILHGLLLVVCNSYDLAEEIGTEKDTNHTVRVRGIATSDFRGPFRCPAASVCGEPLYLTPMLQAGLVEDAQEASKVTFPETPEFEHIQHVRSYSGFLTVNETLKSNIFFWFFLAESDPHNAPVMLWLQGGPGDASTADAFLPNGPFLVDDDLTLILGADRWTESMNVLYIDNPVGAGFSFVQDESGWATAQEDYTRDLYAALSQFFLIFQDYCKNEFFITGVSYGGKYVPALAYEIHNKNPNAASKINLKGMAIGNGLINPLIQIGISEYLYGISAIDSETKNEFAEIEGAIKGLIKEKKFFEASDRFNSYMNGVFLNVTGLDSFDYLWLNKTDGRDQSKMADKLAKIMTRPDFRNSLHVGHKDWWMSNPNCSNHLNGDILQSAAPKLQELLDSYHVLLYNGQLDILCNYPLMIDTVLELKWAGAEDYKKAVRHHWWVEGDLAGYAKNAGTLTEVLIRNAGHEAQWYQPKWTNNLLRRFTHNLPVGS